jgi:hypothetical protein
MGERTMKDCVEEHLITMRAVVLLAPGLTLQGWYDNGANLGELTGYDWDTASTRPEDSVLFAWGYLRGAADQADMTVMEYVESFGLSLNDDDDDGSVGSASVVVGRFPESAAMLSIPMDHVHKRGMHNAATPKKPRRKAKRK